jgi:hypothetical protein
MQGLFLLVITLLALRPVIPRAYPLPLLPLQLQKTPQLTLFLASRNPFKISTSFSCLDPNTSFTSSQPFALAQANNANVAGQAVSENGANNYQDDGFVIGMPGAYSTLTSSYNNNATSANSVAFTAGGTPVPGSLPLLGAGVIFPFSRRLRRRIQA